METKRIWSRKIVNILSVYKNYPQGIIFGITGDIDNLGIFVAKKGRPMAENLVDVYNHIIGIFMYDFVNLHPEIKNFCLIPSGEEIFSIGIAENKKVAECFFDYLHNRSNAFIRKHSPDNVFDPSVTISFGCEVLNQVINISDIENLLIAISEQKNDKASKIYLEIMLSIREKLAYDLDTHKFQDLLNDSDNVAILLRNIVYLHLLSYKKDTKNSLLEIAKLAPEKIDPLIKHELNKIYGLENEDNKNTLIRFLSLL